ncbi:MAG: hypothetical protein NC331_16680 [Lachnospiraceae bacterium]|nr:hypothetical protein [Lachnospiraceae bacterium]MCM1240987.1 hypothetical protein [Lachnospiraceae bacterium]
MWYVVQVMAGREDETAAALNRQGVRALVPKEDRLIRSGGTWTRKGYILFGGYVFLEMDYNADNYYKVRNLPGVVRFLGDGSGPSTLSWLEAEWIRLLTGKDNAPIRPTVVRIGGDGSLEVVDGVLSNFENRITRVDRRNRKAAFEITICGEKKEVRLSIELESDPAGSMDMASGAAPGETQGQAPGIKETV